MRNPNYYMYILARAQNSVFYVGVTNDLIRRINEHRMGLIDGFTKKYHVKMWVYYEYHTNIYEAISREKVIKKWKRQYKINLIESMNPHWKDLYFELS